MQPRAAWDVEAIENLLRIAVRRDVREVAPPQTNDIPAEEVEGRDHVHATKFLSTRMPACDDFSGWNCTPKTRSRCTAAVKGRP